MSKKSFLKKLPFYVTSTDLERWRACEDQVAIFNKEWPKGCQTSLRNLYRAAELDLDLWWFSGEVFSVSALAQIEKRWESTIVGKYIAEQQRIKERRRRERVSWDTASALIKESESKEDRAFCRLIYKYLMEEKRKKRDREYKRLQRR